MAGNRCPALVRWRSLDLLLAVVLVGLGMLVGSTMVRGNDAMLSFLLLRVEAMISRWRRILSVNVAPNRREQAQGC